MPLPQRVLVRVEASAFNQGLSRIDKIVLCEGDGEREMTPSPQTWEWRSWKEGKMAYVRTNDNKLGKRVVLTRPMKSFLGYFEAGSVVTITDIHGDRGYTFTDEHGNSVCEAGWDGFRDA